MTADRLREAARVLRERAEAATPGPWHHDDHKVMDNCTMPHPVTETWEREDAPFIATMHPGVALALADWLDAWAGDVGAGAPWSTDVYPLTVADLILGGAT